MGRTLTFAAVAFAAIVVALLLTQDTIAQPPAALPVTDAMLVDAPARDWPTYGRDYAETHYSPLDQINESNVGELTTAWTFDTRTNGNLEATPIVVNGVMYATGPWDVVFAINARTGEEIWRYDPAIPRTGGGYLCCGPVNRGVAVWGNMVYVGLLDARLIALDAATGELVWVTNTSNDRGMSYSITGAPRVVKGKVIIGNGGAETAARGYVSAYDAQTGALAWRFFTVPGNPKLGFEHPELEMAAKTWNGEWWAVGGGGTVWDGMAYDPEADLLYVGTGNGGPWDRNKRSPGGGDNLFLSSILAIRPDTGELAWYFQEVPGEQWDYTAVQPILLADLEIGGVQRKVLLHAPKNGFFYVLDRLTGEFLSGQKFSRVTWAEGLDEETGRPIENPAARYGAEPVLLSPAPPGAHNWQPMAFHPRTKLVYFPVQHNAFTYAADPEWSYVKGGRNLAVNAGFGQIPEDERPESTGYMVAWDPVAQKEVWRADYGGGTGSGVLATGDNLVFAASPQGDFAAYKADTGEKLWETEIGAGAATPVAFELDGAQYISILSGRGAGTGGGRGGGGTGPALVNPPRLQGKGKGPVIQPSRIYTFALN